MDHKFIKNLRENQQLKQITIGNSKTTPDHEFLDIEALPFFKIPAELYQKFDVIWHDQTAFGNHINWRVILDEMIRLIAREGRIVIAINADENTKVCFNYQRILANVKMYLFRRIGLKCEVEFESPMIYKSHAKLDNLKKGDRIITVFKITRLNLEIYQDKSWTFAMLTGGNKVENVVQFCQSIRDLDVDFRHEILICGPANEAYSKYNVKYIDPAKYRDDYAEICRKKNDVAQAATNQNLLIAHDRFYLGEDFFSGFEKYGYDFDFLAPKVLDPKNNQECCWFLLRKNIFDRDILKFGNFFDASNAISVESTEIAAKEDLSYSFLSGGCLIFKRDILRQIKFNELIFWHQIEDWELSAQFIAKGFVPKVNFFSSIRNSRLDVVEKVVMRKSFMRKIRKSFAKKFLKLAVFLNRE